MDDLISRQAAINAFLTELTKRERKNLLHTWSTVEVKYFVADMLEKLPPAQPVEDIHREKEQAYYCGYEDGAKAARSTQPGWIPCSVMLPENDGVYLVTLRAITQLQKACAKIDIARFDGKWHKAYPVVAWMPLPKPWEGEKNDG